MAVSKIRGRVDIPETLVTTNYGVRVFFKKISGIRILHIEGNPSGQIGGSGHSISLSGTVVETPPHFLVATQVLSSTNAYTIILDGLTLKIQPFSSAGNYVSADLIY